MLSRRGASVLLALLVGLSSCTAGERPARSRPFAGARLVVLATWFDTEKDRFLRVLEPFEQQTGAVVDYRATHEGLPDVLARSVAAGDPPDVAFLPQPGALRDEAAAGALVPLDLATERLVRTHFSAALRTLASYRGRLYGVWFKAANKSLIWYDVRAFERLGVVPPRELTGLLPLARRFAAAGVPAFVVPAGDAWTLTDWFENLYLRLAGPVRYDALATHRLPWTDPSVEHALREMLELLAPAYMSGGIRGALRTGFDASVVQLATRPAKAAMLMEGDFVAGVVTGSTKAVLRADTDAFAFPVGPDQAPTVVAGGDVAVLLRRSAAGEALMRYLATPQAAAPWAAAGGFVSPNLDLDLAVYPDALSRAVARQLLDAGNELRFDLSDLLPGSFGGSPRTGLGPELQSLLVHRDVIGTCRRLEAQARAAFARRP